MVVIAIGEVLVGVNARELSPEIIGSMILLVIQGFFYKFAYFDIFDTPGYHSLKQASRISKHSGMYIYL